MRPKRRYRHMSPLAARAIRDLYYVGKLKQHELARMFGIRQHSVSRIVSEQVWSTPRG
jgi:DNA-binding transcriptional regulator LsrR (DeoR family)